MCYLLSRHPGSQTANLRVLTTECCLISYDLDGHLHYGAMTFSSHVRSGWESCLRRPS